MRMKLGAIMGLSLALVSCQKNESKPDEPADRAVNSNTQSAKPAADNTEKNERDRDPSAVTPIDQGENEVDRGITQQVRQAVIGQDGLSMDAKNAKIITRDGVVTLRGPVASASEKAQIAELARNASGVKQVDNQLEIKAQ